MGAGSAAAAALLTVFSRNHNHIAENVGHLNGPSGAGADEELFQTARHLNIQSLRAVFLKDYLPFLVAG